MYIYVRAWVVVILFGAFFWSMIGCIYILFLTFSVDIGCKGNIKAVI